MFCKKCGAQIADGQTFCQVCGAPVNQPENETQAQPDVNAMFAEKKAKKSKKPIIIAIVAVVVILAIVVIACIPMFKRAFMSEQEIMAMHDEELIEDGLEAISSVLDKVGENSKFNGSVNLNLSEDMVGQIGKLVGNVSTAEIVYDVVSEGAQQGCRFNLILGETEVVSVEIATDAEAGKLYLTVPGLINGALELDIGAIVPDTSYSMLSMIFSGASAVEIDGKVIGDVISIIKAVYSAADGAVSAKESLTINGVSQNCTVYTFSINEETCAKMVVAALEQLKNSNNIKNLIGNLADSYAYGPTREEALEAFEDFCDEGISALTEEAVVGGDDVVVYKMYVDSDDDVIGRSFMINGVTAFGAIVKNGRDVAFEYSIHKEFVGAVELVGKGTEEDDAFTGEVTVTAFENEVLILDFDKFIFGKEKISGSVEIALGSGAEEFSYYNKVVSALSTARVTLNFNVSEDVTDVSFDLSLMNFDLGEVTLSGTPNSEYVPSVPNNVVYSDINSFGRGVNIFLLFSKLAEAGLDLSGLMGMMMGGGIG